MPFTGTVQFKVNGSNVGSPVAVSGASASTTYTFTSAGSAIVEYDYSGDANNTAATTQLAQTVNAAMHNTVLNPVDTPNPSTAGQSVTLSVNLS